jgi:hypothetical protein
MADSSIQFYPDSDGARLRTYERGAPNSLHDWRRIYATNRRTNGLFTFSSGVHTGTLDGFGEALGQRGVCQILLKTPAYTDNIALAFLGITMQWDNTVARAVPAGSFRFINGSTSSVAGTEYPEYIGSLDPNVAPKPTTYYTFRIGGTLYFDGYSHINNHMGQRAHTLVGQMLPIPLNWAHVTRERVPYIMWPAAGSTVPLNFGFYGAADNFQTGTYYMVNILFEEFTIG